MMKYCVRTSSLLLPFPVPVDAAQVTGATYCCQLSKAHTRQPILYISLYSDNACYLRYMCELDKKQAGEREWEQLVVSGIGGR